MALLTLPNEGTPTSHFAVGRSAYALSNYEERSGNARMNRHPTRIHNPTRRPHLFVPAVIQRQRGSTTPSVTSHHS